MSMSSAYAIIGVFAIIALILNIQWLFFAMLFLIAALAVGESLTKNHRDAPPHVRVAKPHKKEQKSPAFLDIMLGNLISSKYKAQLEKHAASHGAQGSEKKEGSGGEHH